MFTDGNTSTNGAMEGFLDLKQFVFKLKLLNWTEVLHG